MLLRTNCPKDVDMTQISSFRAVIELWPSKEALGSDLQANGSTVSKWWQRDSIPAEWWAVIVSTPVAVNAGVTPDLLTALASRATVEART